MGFTVVATRGGVRLVGRILGLRPNQAALRRVCSAVSVRSVGKRGRTEVAGFQAPAARREKSSAEGCAQHSDHLTR